MIDAISGGQFLLQINIVGFAMSSSFVNIVVELFSLAGSRDIVTAQVMRFGRDTVDTFRVMQGCFRVSLPFICE